MSESQPANTHVALVWNFIGVACWKITCCMMLAPVVWLQENTGCSQIMRSEQGQIVFRTEVTDPITRQFFIDSIYAIIIDMATLVVDTSVFVSALIGAQGPSREVLRRCLNGEYDPVVSNSLYLEYEEVCKRRRILNSSPLSSGEIRDLLNAFYSVCSWVPIYYLWRPNSLDEGDNFLIELALAGSASHIVTNNVRDLKNTELKFPNLSIVRPEELLRGK